MAQSEHPHPFPQALTPLPSHCPCHRQSSWGVTRPPDLGDASPPSPRGWAHLEGGPALSCSQGPADPAPPQPRVGQAPRLGPPRGACVQPSAELPTSLPAVHLSPASPAATQPSPSQPHPLAAARAGCRTLPGGGVRRASAAQSLPPGVSTHHELGWSGSRPGAASRPLEPGASSSLSSRASHGLFTGHDPFSPTHLRVRATWVAPEARPSLELLAEPHQDSRGRLPPDRGQRPLAGPSRRRPRACAGTPLPEVPQAS